MKTKIHKTAKAIISTMIIPVIIITVVFFIWSYGHKLYTDHNTYCMIIRINPSTGAYNKIRYTNVRKSSIEIKDGKYLEFVSPENNAKLKFVGKLNYAVICPTNLEQDIVGINTGVKVHTESPE